MHKLDLPSGKGLAALYPGDIGISEHPGVFFRENFESDCVDELGARWTHILNKDAAVISFSPDTPAGSPAERSIRMTATRGQNEGGHLFTVFRPGYREVYARYYAKFIEDHGMNAHFVQLAGAVDPPDYPVGNAGSKFDTEFCTGIEPDPLRSISTGFDPDPSLSGKEREQLLPPGIWAPYTYWPDMHSWQTREGKPDGRPKPYYGNHLPPRAYTAVERDKWLCVEFRMKLNSAPDKSDGEQTFWIDGQLAGHWGPGYPTGRWEWDFFHPDDSPDAAPFEGFRWRAAQGESFEKALINKFWLQHYITDNCFVMNEKYAEASPGLSVNARTATVLFSHVVLADQYIGPMVPLPGR